jgi:hypothetical protein
MSKQGSIAAILAVVLCIAQYAPAQTGSPLPKLRPNTGLLRVNPPTDPNAAAKPASSFDDLAWQREIASQVPLLLHRTFVSSAVRNSSRIAEMKWFKDLNDVRKAIEFVETNLRAEQIPGTALIQVSLEGDLSSADKAIIIEEIGNQFIESHRKTGNDRLVTRAQYLAALMARYEAQLRVLKNQTLAMAGKLQLDGENVQLQGMSNKQQELSLLAVKRRKAMETLTLAKAAYDSAMELVRQGKTAATIAVMIDEHPMVVQWRNQVNQLELTLRQLGDRADAERQAAETRLAAAREALATVIAKTQSKLVARLNEELSTKRTNAETSLKSIEEQIDRLKADLADSSAMIAEYLSQRDEMKGMTELLARAREQRDSLNAMIQQFDLSGISWAAKPTVE